MAAASDHKSDRRERHENKKTRSLEQHAHNLDVRERGSQRVSASNGLIARSQSPLYPHFEILMPPKETSERWTPEMCARFKAWQTQGCKP
jgi:hypothetical protein